MVLIPGSVTRNVHLENTVQIPDKIACDILTEEPIK